MHTRVCTLAMSKSAYTFMDSCYEFSGNVTSALRQLLLCVEDPAFTCEAEWRSGSVLGP